MRYFRQLRGTTSDLVIDIIGQEELSTDPALLQSLRLEIYDVKVHLEA